jgi:hypothetical protein
LSTSIGALLKPICKLWAHLQVYWKAVRMRKEDRALWVIKRCCKDICLSQESLYDSAHSCSLWFRAQELNEDWCFLNTQWQRIYSQLQTSEQWHPVAYWLWKLFSAEESYETHDLELLVIVEAFNSDITTLREVLTQWKFWQITIIYVSSWTLKCWMNNRQWAVRLAVFDFVIKHRLSKTNLTDALLRRSDYVEAISESIDRLCQHYKES